MKKVILIAKWYITINSISTIIYKDWFLFININKTNMASAGFFCKIPAYKFFTLRTPKYKHAHTLKKTIRQIYFIWNNIAY